MIGHRRGHHRIVGKIGAGGSGEPGGEAVGAVAAQPASVLPPTNVPEPVSELIGREEELSEILNLVTKHWLVTVIGAGGIGKTTLALALARELRPHFADGVWLAHPKNWTMESRRQLVRSLRECASAAEDAGVFLSLEGHQLVVLESAQVVEADAAVQVRGPSQPLAVDLQKRFYQDSNIPFVRAQCRQFNRHHAQPVEQILAKFSGANLLRKIAVRRTDHSHINGN